MNQSYKNNFIQAGLIAKQIRSYGKSLIKPGASYNEVINKINQKIVELDAIAAFPPQIALNEIAAHFLPDPDEDIIFSDEVVKLDVGICYQGAIGDCAVTIDLSGKYQHLLNAVENALQEAQNIIKVGLELKEIGKVIYQTISKFNCSTIKTLSGHGLGKYKIHTSPVIPNYDNKSTAIIKPGMTFAIEPFASTGSGHIDEVGFPYIFSQKRLVSQKKEKEKMVYEKIKAYNGLPFAMHDLRIDGISLAELKKIIHEFQKVGMIEGYAALVETSSGMVAQAENSVLVDEDGKVFITTR